MICSGRLQYCLPPLPKAQASSGLWIANGSLSPSIRTRGSRKARQWEDKGCLLARALWSQLHRTNTLALWAIFVSEPVASVADHEYSAGVHSTSLSVAAPRRWPTGLRPSEANALCSPSSTPWYTYPLKNMKISWDYYSQVNGKKSSKPPTRITINYYLLVICCK